jgi:cytidine deaminase
MSVEIIKLAYPIYMLQEQFYIAANQPINPEDQDQILMENIASNLRRINSNSLVDSFDLRLKRSSADVIINDDVRDYEVDYKYMKENSFIFIRLVCDENVRIQRLNARNDISVVKKSSTTKDIDKFEPDIIIDTTATSPEQLKIRLCAELQKLYNSEVAV